jgi:hypothetical protein
VTIQSTRTHDKAAAAAAVASAVVMFMTRRKSRTQRPSIDRAFLPDHLREGL